MTRFAAVAVKAVGAAGVAALLGVGAVSAATPSPSPSSTAGAQQSPSDRHADRHANRRAVRRAVLEAEADVLGLKPQELVKDLKAGQKVSDLARAKGMTKEQFEVRLAANLKPRLEALVDRKVINQARADRVLDRIAKGRVPLWDGIRHPKK